MLCLLSPLVCGLVLYIGWMKCLPIKAHEVRTIALICFAIRIVLSVALFYVAIRAGALR